MHNHLKGLQRMVRKYKISSEWQLCRRKCLVDIRGQRRMGRLVRDDRKAKVTQIATRYNQGMQNTISECTTRRIMKQMGYSSRGPHRVPLLSAKNRKRRLQFTQAHQIRTIEDCKNVAWSDKSHATAYLSIVADHVHPFMTTVYQSSDGYFQQKNLPCHKAHIISD